MECASIQRDASSIAWCPISELPSVNLDSSDTKCNPLYLLASVHQDMDASFNSSSQIEILNTSPSTKNRKKKNNSIYPLGCSSSRQNFTTLTWGQQTSPSESMPLGIIAGGMEDGCITFWNPYDLINNKNTRSLIGSHIDYHQQKITAMQFNPTVSQNTFLATCDVGEKLYIWDLTNVSKPFAQQPPTGKRHTSSNTMSSYPKYSTALAWNNNVSYILAVSNCVGQTQIYDLRNKKVALTFESKNIDKAVAISWNPCKARQLAVCYVKGEAEIWDLKQPKSPKMYLRDHTQNTHGSILDLSWNNIDGNLLLTSHEYDNDVCLGNIWNGNNGKLIHQFSFNKDPKLKIEWNNNRGGVLATMSTEKISLYNVNYFGVKYCPKWLNKKCGAKFGFGGKVVSFGNEYVISASTSSSNLKSDSGGSANTPAKTKRKLKVPPEINVAFLPKSQAMIARAKQFKKTLNSLSTPKDLMLFTENKLKSLRSLTLKAVDTHKEKVNVESDKDILSELGISESESDEEEEQKQPFVAIGNINKSEVEFEIQIWEMIQLFFHEGNCRDDIIKYLGFEKKELQKQHNMQETAKQPLTVDTNNESSDHNLFGDDHDSDTDAEDFFNTLSSKPKSPNLAHKKSTEEFKIIHKPDERQKKTERIERRFEMPRNVDDTVRHAIITGNYRLAIELSLDAGNIADALVFAYYGKDEGENKDLWDVVKKSYFKQHPQQFIASTFSYIAERDYYKLVVNSDLQKWKETLAILLTFTTGDEFNELCNLLGQRIVESVHDLQGAIACFLCSHNISSLITIWNISDHKKATDLVLNSCITKALVYVNTPYVQKSLSAQKQTYNVGEAALSGIFCKYANLLANQGSLEIAQMFLEFVDKKLKKPHGRQANDPQIKQLMLRIHSSQQSGMVQMQKQMQTHVQQQNQNQNQNTRQGPIRPLRQQQRRTSHDSHRGSKQQQNVSQMQAPKRHNRGPRGPPPRSRGGKQQQHAPTQQRPQRPSMPPTHSQRQTQPQQQPQQQPQSQPQPHSSSASPAMPTRRGRGKRRGGGGGRGRGRGGSRGGGNVNQLQANNMNSAAPTHMSSPRGGGMNGTTAMPNRNRVRSPPQQQNMPQQQNIPPRGRQNYNNMAGRAQNMPPQQRQNNMPPPQRQNMQPPQRQNNMPPPQQQQQPPPQQQQQNNSRNMPPRGNRDRGRGRGRGGGRGRPSRPTMSPQQVAPPPHPQPQHQPQPQAVGHIEDRSGRYSAAATSSGTGFFGQTSLLEDDGSQQQLPENAADTFANIKSYLNGIVLDENVVKTMSVTQAKSIKTQSNKLLKDLNDLVLNNKMSYCAYSSLLEIFNSLQGRQYDNAMKQTTEFIKSCKANKQEKFTTHRKWVMAFQSIIRIAKQYNI